MLPFLRPGENILVNKMAYLFQKSKIDDVVIVKNPKDTRRSYLVKRIAKIKDTKLYVLGDNRKESIDSRKFGWIHEESIVGKMVGRV